MSSESLWTSLGINLGFLCVCVVKTVEIVTILPLFACALYKEMSGDQFEMLNFIVLAGAHNFLVSQWIVYNAARCSSCCPTGSRPHTSLKVFLLKDSYSVNRLVFTPLLCIRIAFSFLSGSETAFQIGLHEGTYTQKHNLHLSAHLVPQMTKNGNPVLLLCKRNKLTSKESKTRLDCISGKRNCLLIRR